MSIFAITNEIEGAPGVSSSAEANHASGVHLSIIPENPWAIPGETVTVAVYADGGVGVSAAELALKYGRDVEVVEVKPGPYLGKDTLAGPKSLNEESRQATYTWARIGTTPELAPSGEVVFITLKAANGYPWNTWVTAEVGLADSRFKKLHTISLSFDLRVYDSMPVPVLVQPAARFRTDGAPVGAQPVFRLKTLSPGTLRYRIEVSQEGSSSALHTFDQTFSPQGWDKAKYGSGEVAEFVSPEALQPGQYQWQAYVWVEEIRQWGQSSRLETFEVSSDPMGVTAVRPAVMAGSSGEGGSVALEGWGFTPGSQVHWALPGEEDTNAKIHWESPSKIKVIMPPDTPPGLVTIKLSQPGSRALTAPVLVLPSALFTVQTYLPWAQQVVPGEEFLVRVLAINHGANPDSLAVIEVNLPNPDLFKFLEVGADRGGQVLNQGPGSVWLSVKHGSQATFKFRLSEKAMVSPGSQQGHPLAVGSPLDFYFNPVVLGEVDGVRWQALGPLPAPQRIEAVKTESARELTRIAGTFNNAQYDLVRREFLQLVADNDSLNPALGLITRMQDHGLDVEQMSGLLVDILLGRPDAPFTLAGKNTRCCEARQSQLQVVDSFNRNDLVAAPEGIGDRAYVAEDQAISYAIKIENPAAAPAPVKDVTVMVQWDPGIDLGSLMLASSSHPDAVSVHFDQPRNTATWVFKNINLPPNQKAPLGEAWVKFSVKPLEDMPSGTSLKARAAVRFDSAPPVETNELTYTLDSQSPSTRISPTPSVQFSPNFQVSWEGGDEEGGSGLQSVALLASRNDGPFEVVATTSQGPFMFQGEPGATYGLVTQGTDRVGHVEGLPKKPDAVVTIGQLLSFEPGLHLLGIPVVPDEDSQTRMAVPGSNWSSWDAAQQKYFSGSTAAAPLSGVVSSPDHGLWVHFKAKAKVLITGRPVPDHQPYAIDLHAGWNLIANPFTSEVLWSIDEVKVKGDDQEVTLREAQGRGWVEDFLWNWNGDAYEIVYDSSVIPGITSSLQPFRGYWLEAHRNLIVLLPPPRQSPGN